MMEMCSFPSFLPLNLHPKQSSSIPPFLLCSSRSTFPVSLDGSSRKHRKMEPNSSALSSINPPSSTSMRKTQKGNELSWLQKNAAIKELQNTDDMDAALSRVGGGLRVQGLNIVLRYFGQSKRWLEMSKLFHWMKENEKVNVGSYSSFIKFLGENGDSTNALKVYNGISEESMRYNVSVCNSLLSCLVRNRKSDFISDLFEKMKKGGLTPDTFTYTTLLAGCAKMKNGYSKSLQLIEELKSYGLAIDTVMYGSLLAVCASHNLADEAEALFNQMITESHAPNVFHYSSLLNAYSANGDYAKADKVLKDMKSAGLEPNKFVLTSLLKVYVRAGLFEKSRELLSQLEDLGHAKDEMPYCLLMDGLAKAGQVDEAKALFEELKTKPVRCEGYAYSIIISACCRLGLIDEAGKLANEYEAKSYKYDIVMLNTLLRVHCTSDKMDSVMQIMKKMDELTVSPDWNTFQILIKFFCKKKMYMLAFRTVEDMHRKGHDMDEKLCTSLITYLGQNSAASEAFAVYNMLRYRKRTHCKALHEKMLKILVSNRILKEAYVIMKDNVDSISRPSLEKFLVSFMKHGNLNLINDVLKAYNRSTYPIDQEIFSLAISRYIAEPEKKELLLHLLNWMTGQGYSVDSSTRNLLLKNSELFGRHVIADIMSKQYVASRKSQALPGTG